MNASYPVSILYRRGADEKRIEYDTPRAERITAMQTMLAQGWTVDQGKSYWMPTTHPPLPDVLEAAFQAQPQASKHE